MYSIERRDYSKLHFDKWTSHDNAMCDSKTEVIAMQIL